MATIQFDATDIAPAEAFTVLPPGQYLVEITDSEMKDNAAGTGQYLKLEMSVLDEAFANRKLFANLNIVHSNEKAQEIARRELSAICHSVGVLQVSESEELHGRPFRVEVIVEQRRDTGADANRVKAYMPAGENAPQPFSAPTKPAASKAFVQAKSGPVPGLATKAAPPWAAKKVA